MRNRLFAKLSYKEKKIFKNIWTFKVHKPKTPTSYKSITYEKY